MPPNCPVAGTDFASATSHCCSRNTSGCAGSKEKVILAMGPPTKRMRLNRKTGDPEVDDTWTDPDEAA